MPDFDYVKLWCDKTLDDDKFWLMSDGAQATFFYLLTATRRHMNGIGIGRLPAEYIGADRHRTVRQVEVALNELVKNGMIERENEWIRMVHFIRHQPPSNPNHRTKMLRIAGALPNRWKRVLEEELKGYVFYSDRVSDRVCHTRSKKSPVSTSPVSSDIPNPPTPPSVPPANNTSVDIKEEETGVRAERGICNSPEAPQEAAGAPAAAAPPDDPTPAQEPATLALTPPDGAKRGRSKRDPAAPTWPEELLDIFAAWHERIMGGIPFHRRKKDKLSMQAGDVAAYLRTFKGADGAPKDTAEIRDIYIRFVCVYLCEPAGGDAKADWEHYTPHEHTFGFFASTLPRWAMAAQGNIHRVKDPPDLWKKKNNGAFFVSPTSRDLWPRAVQVQIEEIRSRGEAERAEMDRALDLFTSHRTLEDFTAGGKVGDAAMTEKKSEQGDEKKCSPDMEAILDGTLRKLGPIEDIPEMRKQQEEFAAECEEMSKKNGIR